MSQFEIVGGLIRTYFVAMKMKDSIRSCDTLFMHTYLHAYTWPLCLNGPQLYMHKGSQHTYKLKGLTSGLNKITYLWEAHTPTCLEGLHVWCNNFFVVNFHHLTKLFFKKRILCWKLLFFQKIDNFFWKLTMFLHIVQANSLYIKGF